MILIVLIAIISCLGIIFLFYWIPKKLGYQNTGIILSSVISFFLLLAVFSNIFKDDLFTKSSAIDLLTYQDVILKDNFELISNKSQSGLGDYYHTFTLKISKRDKAELILNIKNSSNFKTQTEKTEDITTLTDRYTGKIVNQNYETNSAFVKEVFEPLGKGLAPNYRIIRIEKSEDNLIFEDIDL